MTDTDIEDALLRSTALTDRIRPLLAGAGADVQGATLVQLVALHLAGHPMQARAQAFALFAESVDRLVPVVEKELFGDAGHPGNSYDG